MIYEDKHLDVLGGFADSRGYTSRSNGPLYKQLRRSAYAKTVVVDTELKGRLFLRLSPTEATFPDAESGYCTPHSPVGRLATICFPGFEGSSRLWGDYRIAEVRSFDRYGGVDFEPNVRNFLSMGIADTARKDAVTDLRAYLGKKQVTKLGTQTEGTPIQESARPPESDLPPQVEQLPAEIELTQFIVVDESDDVETLTEIDSDDDVPDEPPVKQEEYFGLSERFFTHQTIEQNEIIARSPVGAMFVEGIAGSGKTSAALGRTKMLTTFNTSNVTDEQIFRDVIGENQAYWSAAFAGQFSEDSCIGFVRTGELIQYLQETCRRIDLPNLPVHEYKELQTRLREHRRLTFSGVAGRSWSGLATPREAHGSTTMQWLHAADQAIARQIAADFVHALPSTAELVEPFETEAQSKVARVGKIAIDVLQQELQEVASELSSSPREGAFAMDGLAIRLLTKLEEVRKRVMGAKIIWTEFEAQTLYANDENALARKLVDLKAALYLRTGQRLLFLDVNGPLDQTLQLLATTGEPLAWSEETSALLAAGRVILREPSGNTMRAVASDVNHLFIRLLPEATERIYARVKGELHRLPRELGWGRAKFPLLPIVSRKKDDESIDEAAHDTGVEFSPDEVRNSTPDAVFRRLVLRKVIQPLANVADLYLTALQSSPKLFPDTGLVQRLVAQLGDYKLAEEDVDLLLCMSHLLGRGLKQGGPGQLREPSFYQAVFVDEVQDFTEQQVFLMVEQANPKYRAVTVVGDLAQKLHHGSTIDLRSCFPGQEVPHVILTENLRQANAPGLALFSATFRALLQGGDEPPRALAEQARAHCAALVRPRISECETEEAMDASILEILSSAKRNQTVAVLFPNAQEAAKTYKRLELALRERLVEAELSEKVNLARRHVRHFADVSNAKGLEFDVVLLAGVQRYDLQSASDVNRLYVGITRARQSLTLLSGTKKFPPNFGDVCAFYDDLLGLPSD
jgi:hypothetical protein